MDKIKNFFKDVLENASGIGQKTKDLFEKERKLFIEMAVKGGLGILFFFGLIFPLFSVENSLGAIVLRFNGFDMPIGWLWVFATLAITLIYSIYLINKKRDKFEKVFKFASIYLAIFYVWLFINYVTAATDSALPQVNISFGFILVTISFIAIEIVRWKESVIMEPIYKLCVKEVKVVKQPEQPVEEISAE